MQKKDGPSPLRLPLPNACLQIITNFSVFDHILSARHEYTLPSKYQDLLNAIRYADYIVDTTFIRCVSKHLQLPRTKLSYSIPFEELRYIIRNRFRQIKNNMTLRSPPRWNECVKCGGAVELKEDTELSCCLRLIHRECATDDHSCPYCGTSWELLNCCACEKPICLAIGNRNITFNKYGPCSTFCCGAQYHPDCTLLAIKGICRVCGTVRGPLGSPRPKADTMHLFLLRHNMKKRHDYMRRIMRSKYDSTEYLKSVAQPYFK